MDIAHPIRGIIPSLDAAVIEALAGTTGRLTGREVHRAAGTGSVRGVQLVLARLVDQGLVLAEHHPGSILYEANRRHLAWPALDWMAGLRRVLFESIGEQVDAWTLRPLNVSVVGEVARGEGGTGGTVDVLVVRPDADPGADDEWRLQMDGLRDAVRGWTGNRCRIITIDRAGLAEFVAAGEPEALAWVRDGMVLAGEPIGTLVDPAGPPAG
jgi:hypothetical protein